MVVVVSAVIVVVTDSNGYNVFGITSVLNRFGEDTIRAILVIRIVDSAVASNY